jgi:toxin YoeB
VKLVFDREAWAEYLVWQAGDEKVVDRINILIGECLRHPFTGIGKPEPLKRNLAGWWSRRISHEHRLVYRVSGSGNDHVLQVAQCRYRY